MTVEEKTALDNLFKELGLSAQLESNLAPLIAQGVVVAG
ncbi:hypothetical protein SAMN05421731_10925 [Acinetobacter puyangensis]|uniref:Uncharacterized protein n=1 Tax=Acinetobacter puyangensis TaxID=1096779 RepID=A0A240EBV8_9GAMM|nr:hypothetical protein SAMN05421731_10925 [Acinetobacter puyangensis]